MTPSNTNLRIVAALAVALTLASSASSLAGPIDDAVNGPWLTFSWTPEPTSDGYVVAGCRDADPTGGSCFIGADAIAASAPPWTFTAGPSGAVISVTDAFNTGDVFEIHDNGVLLGQTSAPIVPGSCGPNPDECFVHPSASHGVFEVGPGDHSITIEVAQAAFAFGAAYFRVDAVPDTDGDGIVDPDDACPMSILEDTVQIGGCDSGVMNTLFADGCTLTDRVLSCGNGTRNHGDYVSCAVELLNGLEDDGVVTSQERAAIESCVAQSN